MCTQRRVTEEAGLLGGSVAMRVVGARLRSGKCICSYWDICQMSLLRII